MRDYKLGTFPEKGSRKRSIRPKIKGFGYQMLGFGAGGVAPAFVTATGGCITTSGSYKIHTFNSPGTFCVSCAGEEAGSNSVTWMVVGGGGGGGSNNGTGLIGGNGGSGYVVLRYRFQA